MILISGDITKNNLLIKYGKEMLDKTSHKKDKDYLYINKSMDNLNKIITKLNQKVILKHENKDHGNNKYDLKEDREVKNLNRYLNKEKLYDNNVKTSNKGNLNESSSSISSSKENIPIKKIIKNDSNKTKQKITMNLNHNKTKDINQAKLMNKKDNKVKFYQEIDQEKQTKQIQIDTEMKIN
jgi:hypothetical protein